MRPLERLFQLATSKRQHIVLADGEDVRVQEAAVRCATQGIAKITMLGAEDPIRIRLGNLGILEGQIDVVDPESASDRRSLAEVYYDLRSAKGISRTDAFEAMADPLVYAAMRVRCGKADGTVGGAIATTAQTVRTALQIIGRAPTIKTVSSCFMMLACAPQAGFKGGLIFGDCGLIIDPNAEELAAITIASAESCRRLLGEEPRVALLSFSTAGSAQHHSLDKIREAVRIVREQDPDLVVEGEIQFDAALDDRLRQRKCPDSRGHANVFIFPDLASGNIGYKIAQRLGNLVAVGPILQGLAKPANDLSRGSTVDDIVATIAVTAVQAAIDLES
jgi:phosphate acetyltransferase